MSEHEQKIKTLEDKLQKLHDEMSSKKLDDLTSLDEYEQRFEDINKELTEAMQDYVISKVNLHEVSLLSDGSHGIGGRVGPKETGSDDVDYNFKH